MASNKACAGDPKDELALTAPKVKTVDRFGRSSHGLR